MCLNGQSVGHFSSTCRQVVFFDTQVLKVHQGTISIKELSEMTAIKVDDVVSTLQHLNLIQYQKGQHVICGAPKIIDRSACLSAPQYV